MLESYLQVFKMCFEQRGKPRKTNRRNVRVLPVFKAREKMKGKSVGEFRVGSMMIRRE